ncbi:hypothetical protein JL722_1077 [Aureococcus anophagefferens]|nr:hypothetical protein JL722_1077 [Aureococcus anophagefferens]
MESVVASLTDPERPTFLHGMTPPLDSTSVGDAQVIADKFIARSRNLASDGFIVYDIQDEPSRSGASRPFPFRQLMDSSTYAALVSRSSGKPCVVYKCCDDENFEQWLETAADQHGHDAINVVGRPSADAPPKGPSMREAMALVAASKAAFGCVCIPERHTDDYAKSRGKAAPGEHENMLRKHAAGAQWFISQAVYDAGPTIRLLRDYGAACRARGLAPRKVVLTFAPCGRAKTMVFLKWLGVRVPEDAEKRILDAESPVDESVTLLCELFSRSSTRRLRRALGVSVESVSIFKKEIEAVHDLFRKTQAIALDHRGKAWKVTWSEASAAPAAPAPAAAPAASPAVALAAAALAVSVACLLIVGDQGGIPSP